MGTKNDDLQPRRKEMKLDYTGGFTSEDFLNPHNNLGTGILTVTIFLWGRAEVPALR